MDRDGGRWREMREREREVSLSIKNLLGKEELILRYASLGCLFRYLDLQREGVEEMGLFWGI